MDLTLIAKWVGISALVVFLILVGRAIYMKNATPDVDATGMLVTLLPDNYPYASDLQSYCYQAALNGWTPSNCTGLYDYTQYNYPNYYPYIQSYFPAYYNNYWGSGWNNWWRGDRRHDDDGRRDWSGRGGHGNWGRGGGGRNHGGGGRGGHGRR